MDAAALLRTLTIVLNDGLRLSPYSHTVHANAQHSLGPRHCESPKGVDSSALWQLKEHCTAIPQRRDGRKIVPWYRCRDDRLPQKAANSSARWNYGGSRPNLSHVVANEILATYAWHAHLTGKK